MSLTVDLPEPMLEALQAEATRRGVSIDVVIAESVQEHLASAPPRRTLSFVGIGSSGETDGAERHREIIAEAYAQKTAGDV